MKAIVIDGYGGPDRLQLRDQPDPKPSNGELLVRVRAAGVNPVDWKIRRGDLRMFLRIKFPYIPGGDIAGEVVAIGPGVTRFKPGDEVVAFVEMARGGGYAELAVVKESATALKSHALSFVEAASLPIAAATALQSLRDLGGLHHRRLGPDPRRVGRRRPLRGADRQGSGRHRGRDLRSVQRRVRPFARCRPRHRLHQGRIPAPAGAI